MPTHLLAMRPWPSSFPSNIIATARCLNVSMQKLMTPALSLCSLIVRTNMQTDRVYHYISPLYTARACVTTLTVGHRSQPERHYNNAHNIPKNRNLKLQNCNRQLHYRWTRFHYLLQKCIFFYWTGTLLTREMKLYAGKHSVCDELAFFLMKDFHLL